MASPKICYACKAVLPIGDFYKHPKSADGHLNKCKSCCRIHAAANRLKNIKRIRQYDVERSKNPNRIAEGVRRTREKRQSDPRYMHCHNAVARALKNGALQRFNCERCGHKKSVAHHESYDQPLKVVWLCNACHSQTHKEMDAISEARRELCA